jgi:hypothetical protein
MLGGDFHNGPLKVPIPFWHPGQLGVWLGLAAIRTPNLHFRYGDPELKQNKQINISILALFVTKTIALFGVFGNFYSEAVDFLGLIGLSISLNHGIRKRQRAP